MESLLNSTKTQYKVMFDFLYPSAGPQKNSSENVHVSLELGVSITQQKKKGVMESGRQKASQLSPHSQTQSLMSRSDWIVSFYANLYLKYLKNLLTSVHS